METRAVGKYIRISPQKARLVADVVRGMNVDQAITTLKFMPKKAAVLVRQVVESAVANATQNDQVDVDSLFIKKHIYRWRAVAQAYQAAGDGAGYPDHQALQPYYRILDEN